MSHHKIEAQNIKYTYPDGNPAINDVSFLITHGESVGIIGANGAGKSTLLMLLMGVIFPSQGEIVIGDIKMTKKTLASIRQHLGFVFQNPDDQLFMNTVYDDVAFGPRNYGLDESETEKHVMESLEITGIAHLKNRPPYKISGGEKRAAAIASVLSMQPDILIMDEPTSELDPKARRRMINLLKSFTHTKMIASHDMDMIYDVCDKVIVIKDGSIKANGDTKSIVTDLELMDDCGLEIPLFMQGC